MPINNKKQLSAIEKEELLKILKIRFSKNMNRHNGLEWREIQAKLELNLEKLWSLNEMENTGGEPDVIYPTKNEKNKDTYYFYDCSEESPKGRRSLCYDRNALDERKEHKPENSATDLANSIGIELLTEDDYRELQNFGKFDLKTSSWLKTPIEIRKLGGSIFGDLRYNQVFIYHNGAQSYYAARGFRGKLKI